MQTGIYSFACRFETEAFLPAFKGSTIRGGLGHALKRITCALRRQDCLACLLSKTCAYAVLYETEQGQAPAVSGRTSSVVRKPHPYVLVPPDDQKRHYRPDELLSFEILLFGPAIQYLPHVVCAVAEMGKTGLGKGARDGSEGRFRLEAVYQDNTRIYDGVSLAAMLPPAVIQLDPAPVLQVDRLSIYCLTPLRLKYTNHLQTSLPFHLLIRAALRRISALESSYGEGEPVLDYRGLAARAADVVIENADCRWKDIERYSARQKTAMLMGGILGTITYQGKNLAEFLPLLRYCERVHLGKQTSFGLGRITVEAAE